MSMTNVWLALAAAALSTGAGPTPQGAGDDPDRAAIRRSALDYAQGFYEGSVERMARALHPALLKRGLLPPGVESRFLQLMNAEMLIDLTDSARGRPTGDRHFDFALFDVGDDVASARIFTDQFNDYLLLAKQDGRWRIVSVLWQVPASAGSEPDKVAVKKAVGEYFEGLYAADAARIRAVVHPEFVRRTLRPGARGSLVLDDLNVDRLLGAPQQLTAVRSYAVQVRDVHDRIASASVTQEGRTSHVHLAEQGGRWRLINMLSR
jgi:hypothetical protein